MGDMPAASNVFRRLVLPGLAFKAVVIGGGYATGRELVEFFLGSGPWGGLAAMLVATAIWSLVAALTFAFAFTSRSFDYRSFFRALLGRAWVLYEVAFILLLIIVLAVFGAAAGALGTALVGWPPIAGTLLLVLLIIAVTASGTASVEELFKYVSFLLYGVYAVFLVLALFRFGDRISAAFGEAHLGGGWLVGGVTYAGYNIVGAVSILPVVRHMRSRRDAVVAGLLAGPLAMVPAVLFFVCMCAWPEVTNVPLPSDYLLARLGAPWLRWIYQLMIFAALLESGTGLTHAFNERIASALGSRPGGFSRRQRLAVSIALLAGAVFLADRFGLVRLIADGYRFLAYALICVYVIPLATIGLWRLRHPPAVG